MIHASSTRTQRVHDFVARGRMVPVPVIHRKFFAHATRNAASKFTGQEVRKGYLNRYRLTGNRFYFTPGPCLVRKMNLPASFAKKVPPQRFLQELGSLYYCSLSTVERTRLLRAELSSLYPWIPQKKLQRPYYLHTEGDTTRLATIRVEFSQSAYNIHKKHKKELHQFRDTSLEFRTLCETDGFLLAIITASDRTRDKLIAEIERDVWFPPCVVFSCPDLLEFVPQGSSRHA